MPQSAPPACTEHLAKVRLPWLELRPADTYEALCDSLIQLDEAVEEIFGRVERRLAEEQRTLKGLEERIERAGVLARRVAGSNAATCVLSAARYPAPDKLPDHRRLFYDEEVFAANARKALALAPPPAVEAAGPIVERREALHAAMQRDADALPDYLAALALRPGLACNSSAAGEEGREGGEAAAGGGDGRGEAKGAGGAEGLGPLPEALLERGSAANLLVFNSEHNAYVEWRRIDNLSGEEEQACLARLASYHPCVDPLSGEEEQVGR